MPGNDPGRALSQGQFGSIEVCPWNPLRNHSHTCHDHVPAAPFPGPQCGAECDAHRPCRRRGDGRGHGAGALLLHAGASGHDGGSRARAGGSRVDRLGQLHWLSARRGPCRLWLGGGHRAQGCACEPGRHGVAAARHGPFERPGASGRHPLSRRPRQRLRHDLHHGHRALARPGVGQGPGAGHPFRRRRRRDHHLGDHVRPGPAGRT